MNLHDILSDIAHLNTTTYGRDDWYSNEGNLTQFVTSMNGNYVVITRWRRVVSYNLIRYHKDHVEGIRLATHPAYQGRGFGSKLVRQSISKARSLDLPYQTYTSHDNTVSCNLHIRSGMLIRKVDAEWIHLTTPEKRTHGRETKG